MIQSSIEETALAVEALAIESLAFPKPGRRTAALIKGVESLIEQTNRGTRFDPSPIGFYFAKLWYFEKLYPLIFTVAALGAVKQFDLAREADAGTESAVWNPFHAVRVVPEEKENHG